MPVPAHPNQLSSKELATWFGLRDMIDTIRDRLDAQLRESGITLIQWGILMLLFSAPDRSLRMTELADGLVASRSALTYQIGVLGKDGVVVRTASLDDGRGMSVRLTDSGEALLTRLLPPHDELIRQLFFDLLDDKSLDGLSQTVGVVNAHLQADPPRSVRRRSPVGRATGR